MICINIRKIASRHAFRTHVLLFALLVCSLPVRAVDPFIISDIRVEGLQRISAGTVFNYLPVKTGDEFDDEASAESIRALFKTGFFKDVQLSRQNRTLIVRVEELPTIYSIEFTGNKGIEDKALRDAMTQAEFIEGRVFNPTTLDQVVQELKSQYFSRGKYAAQVETEVTELERNRVAVQINIREGDTAKIQQISIIGNEFFDDKEIKKQLEASTESIFNFFSKKDQYSKEQLSADLETLTSFYQDQGFLNFRIVSSQVSITPDKESVYLTINIEEGERYTVSQFSLSGRLIVPEEDLLPLVFVEPGRVYNRAALEGTVEVLGARLAEEGYAFAEVNPVPEIDDENHTVSFVINVNPGRRVYVRRIEIEGNTTTRDEVIRRELRQLEGGWFSPERVRRSKIRLQRLGFFDEVEIDNPPVPGSPDQVDLMVSVVERSTGSFLVGLGFSGDDGLLAQASISQANLFGTGKQLSFGIDYSSIVQSINIQYTNPYATESGISRSLNLIAQRIDSREAQTAAYITETYGAGISYLIPMSEYNSFALGVNVERINLESTQFTPLEIRRFIEDFPKSNNLKLVSSIAHDTRDSIIYPTRGGAHSINVEVTVPGSDLEYYKVNVRSAFYVPLFGDFTFKISGDVGYGDGYGELQELPFFKNYFAGGTTSVRGYRARSLGPRSLVTFDPLGGAKRILGNASFLIPIPGTTAKDKRFSLFVDAGQVWAQDDSIELSEMRASAGIAFNWLSPVGPLAISYAKPLNDKEFDETESLQFSIGRVFE
jgi:outer membrane protein insertion porin family